MYSEEEKTVIIDNILNKVKEGMAVRDAIKEFNIGSETFYRWIDNDENKAKQYARACDARADAMAEDILNIADDQEGDILIIDGKEVPNHNVIQRSKLRVDARKWLLSKMNPKKYGDKIDHTSGGEPIKQITGYEVK